MDPAFIASSILFLTIFGFIITERVHRTVIAFFGAVAMMLMGSTLGFYDTHQAIGAIDFNAIGLLLGMMIIVVILEGTGFFQYLGIYAAKKTRGKPWLLLASLGTLTTILSLLLDNVTTIILIAPVTIIITRILGLNPIPILMAEALLADTGGIATLVGDPTTIMIGSAAEFTFNDFLIHSAPVVAVTWIATLFLLKFVYRKELRIAPKNIDDLDRMDPRSALKDICTVKKTLAVLGFVVGLFLFHGSLGLQPSMVALIGAALALLLVSAKKDPQKIFEKIELSILFFFASLFIIVGGLEYAGVLEYIAHLITQGAAENLLATALIILWSAAILSAIIDNIPLTVAMIPIIHYLGAQGVDITLLWWALVFGVGFGGNGSPIGSTANVIIVAKSEQTDTPITFRAWLRAGTPAMFLSLTIATVAILLFGETFFS